jgi:lipopolysaccharide export LptBFGC system permease protein LptF
MLDSNPVRILTRYYISRYLGLYFAILLLSTLSISMVEAMLRYDEIFGADASAASAFESMLLRIPSYYLPDLIPISAFAACFLTLGLSARALELTALAAGGIPLRRVGAPILAAALALSAGSLVVQEILIIQATQGWNTQTQNRDQRLIFHRGAFWYHKGNRLFNISGSEPETSTLRGVEVFERTPEGRLESTIRASRVSVDSEGTWHFREATVRRFDVTAPEAPATLERGVDLSIDVAKDPSLLLRQADFSGLPLLALRSYLSQQGQAQSPSQQSRVRRLQTDRHRRSSAPLRVLLFTLLAIPMATPNTPG